MLQVHRCNQVRGEPVDPFEGEALDAYSQVVAGVAERLGGVRDLKLQRLGFAPTTCPTTPVLEDLFYPDARRVAVAARDMVEGKPTGWLPEERPELKSIMFRGPF